MGKRAVNKGRRDGVVVLGVESLSWPLDHVRMCGAL